MTDTLTIGADHVVGFNYTLTDNDGNVIDTSEGSDPMYYLHGHGNIIPGLENHLNGQGNGYKGNVSIPPAEAYGEVVGPGPQAVEKGAFPPGAPLHPGAQFQAQGEDGEITTIYVTDVDDEHVYVDTNHPLAGVTLNFAVEVVAIRAATDDEKAHGHPHGPDGSQSH